MANSEQKAKVVGPSRSSIKAYSISGEIEETAQLAVGSGDREALDRTLDSERISFTSSPSKLEEEAKKLGNSQLDAKKRDVLSLIFGTSYNSEDELLKHSDVKQVAFGPRGRTRAKWDSVFIVTVMYSLFYWPLYCAFRSGEVDGLYIVDKLVNLVTLTDVVRRVFEC